MESKPAPSGPGELCFAPHTPSSSAACWSAPAQDWLRFILFPLSPIQRLLYSFNCWRCSISLLLWFLYSSTSTLCYTQLGLYDLYPAETWQINHYEWSICFSQLKYVFLSWSVRAFHKDKKTFPHYALYTNLNILHFVFLCCTKWWHA